MKNKYYHEKVLLKVFLLNGNNSVHGIKRFCMAILMLTSPIDITRNILTRSALALISGFSWHNLKLNKENFFRTCNEHNSSFFSSLVLLRIHS